MSHMPLSYWVLTCGPGARLGRNIHWGLYNLTKVRFSCLHISHLDKANCPKLRQSLRLGATGTGFLVIVLLPCNQKGILGKSFNLPRPLLPLLYKMEVMLILQGQWENDKIRAWVRADSVTSMLYVHSKVSSILKLGTHRLGWGPTWDPVCPR